MQKAHWSAHCRATRWGALADAQLAIDFIYQYGYADGQKSRLAMLNTIVNKARKALRN
ncbi:hypothetical protein [Aeromonas veronii]|uniref:hypothetical protein n=1 Tax=Aeromonas veronii TaxID=654 RepID=UPI0024440401|nr:hypothetical protein [Aeromonas veronii]